MKKRTGGFNIGWLPHDAPKYSALMLGVGLLAASMRVNAQEMSDKDRIDLIARANQSALEQVRTVEASYTRRRRTMWPNRVEEMSGTQHIWWWMEGDRHRLRTYVDTAPPGEKTPIKRDVMDVLLNGDRCSMIDGYDWEKSAKVKLGDHSITGLITKREPYFPQVNPLVDVMLYVQARPVSRSLSRLIRDSKEPPQVEKVMDGNRELWEITATTPDEGRELRIQVDPAVNYLVRRIWRSPTSEEQRNGLVTMQWDVDKFDEVEPGVFFPAKAIVRTPTLPQGQVVETVLEFSTLKLNHTLPADIFQFKFPKNVTVADKIGGVTHVWGDDKPAHTIHNMKEDEALGEKLLGKKVGIPQKSPRGWSPYVWWAMSVIGVAMIVGIWARKKLRA